MPIPKQPTHPPGGHGYQRCVRSSKRAHLGADHRAAGVGTQQSEKQRTVDARPGADELRIRAHMHVAMSRPGAWSPLAVDGVEAQVNILFAVLWPVEGRG